MYLLIKNARVIDPASGLDTTGDILIENGVISNIGRIFANCETIDATGLIAAPALVDMHVHLRDPGFEYKETIETGLKAAARGGFCAVACMPNTKPVGDNKQWISYVLQKSKEASPVKVFPIAALTEGQLGEKLCEVECLYDAGAVAFSDDGRPVMRADILRNAMLRLKPLGATVISHCEDETLVSGRSINEGAVSAMLGASGRPAIAEELMVSRDIMLAEETGARLHIAHVSTARSVDIIRKAKARGVSVTCETCPQYFTFTEQEVVAQGNLAKIFPPLRTEADVEGIILGLIDGTIDVIATDHAPHTLAEKALSLDEAPGGMVGLETALAASISALSRVLPIGEIIKKLSYNPAKVLGIDYGSITKGMAANILVFNPTEKWTVKPEAFLSKGRNTLFGGRQLRGTVKHLIIEGKLL